MRRKIILLCLFFAILLSACTQKEAVSPTSITVDDKEIKLGMRSREIQEIFSNIEFKIKNTTVHPERICNDVRLIKAMWNVNIDEVIMVLGCDASVRYIFNEMGELQELHVCWNGNDRETIFSNLKDLYGEDYTTEWVAADYKTSAYKWDMEDGTSMVFMPDSYRRIEKD